MNSYPVTPDGRYFVVKERLWRCSDPSLQEEARKDYVAQLMAARRAVRSALRAQDEIALKQARHAVDQAKILLGERGAVWWSDGTPDYNRKNVRNTPYADWFEKLSGPD